MATFADLKKRALLLLKDTEKTENGVVFGEQTSAEILKAATIAALHAVASRVWKPAELTIAKDVTSVDLPDDFIDVVGVYLADLGAFIPEVGMNSGDKYVLGSGNAYVMFPDGKITFTNKVGTNGGKLYYSAMWTEPSDDTDEIEAPASTHHPIVLFIVSYVLAANAVASARIRQYNTRVDSGQPDDIPAKTMSEYFLKRFESELARIPVKTRGRRR